MYNDSDSERVDVYVPDGTWCDGYKKERWPRRIAKSPASIIFLEEGDAIRHCISRIESAMSRAERRIEELSKKLSEMHARIDDKDRPLLYGDNNEASGT